MNVFVFISPFHPAAVRTGATIWTPWRRRDRDRAISKAASYKALRDSQGGLKRLREHNNLQQIFFLPELGNQTFFQLRQMRDHRQLLLFVKPTERTQLL